jgi:hypothetical protein
MLARAAALLVLLAIPVAAVAQPVPLYPGAEPPSIQPQALPALPEPPPGAGTLRPPAPGAPPPADVALSEPAGARVFCHQTVTPNFAAAGAAPERDRRFLGIWSDASWTPMLCAALIVEDVRPDGTARIQYVFGTMNANPSGPGGVLRGTGIIKRGELRFQNSDGSQFAFGPLYGDLEGRLVTPHGQSYQAIFKKTP